MSPVALSSPAPLAATQVGRRAGRAAWRSVAVAAALGGILVLATAVRLVSYKGYWGTDDGEYSVLANAMAKGQFWEYVDENYVRHFNGPAHIPYRSGAIVPLALAYRTFGVSETTLVAYPFLISVLGTVVAFLCARHFFGDAAGLVAAALWALVPIDVEYATGYLPDGIASFYASVALLVLFTAIAAPAKPGARSFGLGLAAGLLFGMSWLTKESVTYLVPFCGVLMFTSARGNWRAALPLWIGVAVGAGGVLLAEMTYYGIARGDFLLRMHENERSFTQTKSYLFYEGSRFGWAVGGSHLKALAKRLLQSGPETIFLNGLLLALPLFGLLAFVRGWVVRDRSFRLVGLWLMTLALMYNFGSPTFKSYTPLVLLDRYLIPIVLPAIVLTAGLLVRLLQPMPARASNEMRERLFWGVALAATLVAIAATENFNDIRGMRRVRPMFAERYAATLISPRDTVYTDPLARKALEFYWRYPESRGVLDFEGMRPEDVRPGSYVLVDTNRLDWLHVNVSMWLTKDYGYHRPTFADHPPGSWKIVWRDFYLTLYKAA